MKHLSGSTSQKSKNPLAIVNSSIFTISIFLGTIVLSGSKPVVAGAVPLFKKVADRLMGLKSVRYQSFRELHYPDESYHVRDSGNMYVEFDKVHDVAGFRFQHVDSRGFAIFNNSEIFYGNSTNKTLIVTHHVKFVNLERIPTLHNSIITLRNILPAVIKDESIDKHSGDTLINGKGHHLLTFKLRNKVLNYTGTGFSQSTQPFTFTYKMIVDKATNFPITLLQTRSSSSDLIRNDFLDISTKPKVPAHNIWYYSTYLKEYTIANDKPLSIISAGQTAPDWQLTNYKTNAEETLAQHKGKLVLMEFWIRHCGYCIEAVAGLNRLHDKYKADDFLLLAINTEATRENLRQFDSKHPMKFGVMYGDKPEVNKSYGVGAFPQVVLVAKDGKVVYSGGIDIGKLEELIERYK